TEWLTPVRLQYDVPLFHSHIIGLTVFSSLSALLAYTNITGDRVDSGAARGDKNS
ncbi:unnamed protein product, partial [Amoebophrya sp. A120]